MKWKAICVVTATQTVEVEVEADSEAVAIVEAERQALRNADPWEFEAEEADIEDIAPIEYTEAELAAEERKKALAAGQMDMFEGVL